jgi:hypothetical protein
MPHFPIQNSGATATVGEPNAALLRAGANVNSDILKTMIHNGCVEIVATILKEGSNVDLESELGLQPLQVVAILLQEGHYARDGRLVDIARMMLRAGARADAGNPTPLNLVDPEWHFFIDYSPVQPRKLA